VRVHVDTELCQGHAQCILVAEEVFELTDDAAPVARMLLPVIPPELEESVLDARDRCPVEAIIVLDDASG
jgi:ferredoxin